MEIEYRLTKNTWDEYPTLIKEWVVRTNAVEVCDIGGGANPILDIDFIYSRSLEYTVLDLSQSELDKIPDTYKKEIKDVEAEDFSLEDCFDLAFSKMLAEHIKNGEIFHRNIHQMLKPGGIAIHYFPTLYALPFVVNKLIPEKTSSALLGLFAPRDKFQQAKFPAYYNWCFGPTPSMLNMLTAIGFEILEFNALIGHVYYNRIPLIRELHQKYSKFLVRHPNPRLTSFAQVVLKKN